MNLKNIAEQIFRAGVESVLPDKLIRNQVYIKDSILCIASFHFSLNDIQRIFVIGAGKASALMAKEIESILDDRITAGHVVVKYGHACQLKNIEVTEAGHPVPDNNGFLATKKILEIARQANEHDLIICLLSGGGSALLVDFPEGSSLNDIIALNDLLLKSGATIKEINAVRKHLSNVKGGQLARVAFPAKVISLILSDVIGDPLDVIASGPTVPDTSTYKDAISVLEKYNLHTQIPQSIISHLKKGVSGIYLETPKDDDAVFKNTHNLLIGSNKIALEAARQKALNLGLHPILITAELQGDASKVAEDIVSAALKYQKDSLVKKPCCLLFGGETTVKVSGKGTGGRNQHLALSAALLLKDKKGITILAAGTDGTDGLTDVAGAVVDSTTNEFAAKSSIESKKYLNNFDSFHFFEKVGGHITTGPTMTNVMDLVIVVEE